MGYRSSVYIQIPNDRLDEFWEHIDTGINNSVDDDDDDRDLVIAGMKEGIKDLLDSFEQKHILDAKVYFSDSIKWYTSDDVLLQVIEDSAREMSSGYFLRTGEDFDDIDYCDEWVSNGPLYSIYSRSVTCVGTEDAVESGLKFFACIEKAPPNVRRIAIDGLQKVLARLMEAEGLSPLPETTDFEE